MEHRLIIFDLDWTLAIPESEETFRKPGEKYIWLDGQKALLEELHQEGQAIAVATNQGGIGAGHLEYGETRDAIHALLSQLSFYVPWVMCPFFPDETQHDYHRYRPYQFWRKPSYGMLHALADLFPHLHYDDMLCVGDRKEDAQAAHNAGFDFLYIEEFLVRREAAKLQPPAVVSDEVDNAPPGPEDMPF